MHCGGAAGRVSLSTGGQEVKEEKGKRQGPQMPFKVTFPIILRALSRPHLSKFYRSPIAPWTNALTQGPSGTVQIQTAAPNRKEG